MLDLTLPLEIAGVAFLLLVLFVVGFTVRRHLLTRSHGSFDCGLRDNGRWTVGIARYGQDRIDFYRVFGVGLTPARTFRRNLLEILSHRDAGEQEQAYLLPGSVICACRYAGAPIELALSMDAYMGLASWTEAGPPGQQWTTS